MIHYCVECKRETVHLDKGVRILLGEKVHAWECTGCKVGPPGTVPIEKIYDGDGKLLRERRLGKKIKNRGLDS